MILQLAELSKSAKDAVPLGQVTFLSLLYFLVSNKENFFLLVSSKKQEASEMSAISAAAMETLAK